MASEVQLKFIGKVLNAGKKLTKFIDITDSC
jgi:hypothetical protein